jgi:hypothetical protein
MDCVRPPWLCVLTCVVAPVCASRVQAQVQEPEEAKKPSAKEMLEQMKPPKVGSGPGCGNGYEILLQAFNWESWKTGYYKQMSSKVKEIASAGFTAVWLPPPSDSVSEQVRGEHGHGRVETGVGKRGLFCRDALSTNVAMHLAILQLLSMTSRPCLLRHHGAV